MKAQVSLKARCLSMALTLLGPIMAWSGPASPQVNAPTTIAQVSSSLKTKTLPVRKIMENGVASKAPKALDIKALLSDERKVLNSGGGMDSGGGDARKIRSLILTSKSKQLRSQVVKIFSEKSVTVFGLKNSISWLALGQMKLADQKSQNILNEMIKKGFQSELNKVEFILSDRCLDLNGVEKSATAKMNKPGSKICVNPDRIVAEFGPYIQDSDLVGLAMHELAHHYGFEDADHSFAAAVALEWQKDSEQRNQDGEPLNSLIQN